jgi:hypothetical protein
MAGQALDQRQHAFSSTTPRGLERGILSDGTCCHESTGENAMGIHQESTRITYQGYERISGRSQGGTGTEHSTQYITQTP